MNSLKSLRRSRVQTTFDPYELPLYSDLSQDESNEVEPGDDPVQQNDKLYRVILGPQPTDHSPEFEDPKSRKRGVKRKRPSEQIRPLSDYLYQEERNSDSELHEIPSDCRENHASVSQSNDNEDKESQERRTPTFCDAQSRRLNFDGFIPKTPRYSDGRDRPSMRMNPIPPDALLLHDASVKSADHLYQDFSIPDPNLPRRELVQALHTYASNFYAHAIPGGGEIDYCSMDASALMAIAKLLETTLETTIGETGDLAFTEGASFEDTGGPRRFYAGVGSWEPRVLEKGTFDYWELLNSQRGFTENGRAATKARLAQSGSRDGSGGRSSRKACAPCYKQKKTCDHGHPCARCIALKRVDHCVYESDSGTSRSRSRGRSNCKPCYKQKRACDRGYPCATCIKYGREGQCIYDSNSQDEGFNSKVSLSSQSDSANSSISNAQMSSSDNLEEQHSNIGADGEMSNDEGDEVKVEAMKLALRGRPVTRSSPRDHSVSPVRRSKRSRSERTPRTFGFRPEEEIEMDLDNLSSDDDPDSRSHQHNAQTEGARLNAERDTPQDLSVEQLGIDYGGSFESDVMDSDADESDGKDALVFDDDLDTSSEYDSSE